MSFRSLLITLTFLGVFAMALRISTDTDTWWHLRTGEAILHNGQVPMQDAFSHTRDGEPWLYPSAAWLSQVQLYAVHQAAGFGGLNVWVALLVTLAFALVYAAMPRGGLFLRGSVLLLAAASAAVYWAARPYMLSFVLSALTLWLLEAARAGQPRRLWWLPLVMLVWANSHPGFAVGFILLAIYAMERIATWLQAGAKRSSLAAAWQAWGRNLLLVTLAMLLAVCLNPAGPRMLQYPFDTVGMDVLGGYIQEWQSPNFHEARIWPFALLLGLTGLALIFAPRRPAVYDLLLVAVLGGMSLLAARNIALFALTAPLVLLRNLPSGVARLEKKLRYRRQPTPRQVVLHTSLALLALVAVLAKASAVLPAEANWRQFRSSLPVAAVEHLQTQPMQGTLFNSYNWGGYLIWALPQYPVFADGRTDLYGDELLGEWLAIANAEPGWQALLEARGVTRVLLEPGWALSKVLPHNGWVLLHLDENSLLFGK